MEITLGEKVNPDDYEVVFEVLKPFLFADENIVFLGRASNFYPMSNWIVITNSRILEVTLQNAHPIKVELAHQKASSYEIGSSGKTKNCLLFSIDGEPDVNFAALRKADFENVLNFIQEFDRVIILKPSSALAIGIEENRFGQKFEKMINQKPVSSIASDIEEIHDPLRDVPLIGAKPNKKSVQAILAHCQVGEVPRFVLSSGGGAGILTAYDDRLMIIKTGGMAGFMSGSMLGGRVSTFHYSEITGIEFNSGWISGVLEILTASYDGSKNKDYWRGSSKSRNADSNDPWTLSNCLPIGKELYNQAQGQLNEMRKWISESKNPKVVISQLTSVNHLADEIMKLSQLRDQGILSEIEFTAAKQKLLS